MDPKLFKAVSVLPAVECLIFVADKLYLSVFDLALAKWVTNMQFTWK